jgi:poly(hydroxyalkanoate) depolymerase family esterase
MFGLNAGARRPFALLAAVCVAAAMLWIVVSDAAPATARAPAARGAHHSANVPRARLHAMTKRPARRTGRAKHSRAGLQGHRIATSLRGHLTGGSYTSSAGTLDYELYVPSTYRKGTPIPLVVGLHGCTQSADAFRRLSRFDAQAESKHFIVLFPGQLSSRNFLRCWNWFVQADMQRGSGEPAIIAGMVHAVEKSYSVNARRVYVGGFSAGGAMANVMGATYPDMFAAVGSGSGCEYNGLPCVGYQGPPPSQTGLEAYRAMGRHARVMPAIVFQGDADYIVAPANGTEIAQEWRVTDNYVVSRSPNGPIPTYPTNQSFGSVPNGLSYTIERSQDGHGSEVIEYWSIHGMGHAWSGGDSSQQYAEPSGPRETDAMYAFFAAHPRR